MATRFYFPSTGAAEVTPTNAAWDKTSGAGSALKAVKARINSAMATVTNTKTSTSPSASLIRQYVTGPLGAQTISGTVKGQFRCNESNANFSACIAISIRACSNDGSTIRSPALLAITNSDLYTTSPHEFVATTLTNRKLEDVNESASITLTSCTLQNGDRLVIELGFKASDTSTTRTGGISFGDDNATDLGENTTDTAAYNPWIEFSQTITDQLRQLTLDATGARSFTLTGKAASPLRGWPFTGAKGTFTETGVASGLLFGRLLGAGIGSFAETGITTGVLRGYLASASAGAFTLSLKDATLTKGSSGKTLPAAAGAFTFSGIAVGLYRGRAPPCSVGAFTLTGRDVTLLNSQRISAGAGAFSETGRAAGLYRGYALSTSAGGFALSGIAASPLVFHKISASAGNFTLTGKPASLVYTTPNRIMAAGCGTFTETGISAALCRGRIFSAGAGALAVTGQTATPLYGRAIAAAPGAFAETGQAASLTRSRILAAGTGAFIETGKAATLTYISSGFVPASVTLKTVEVDREITLDSVETITQVTTRAVAITRR